MSYYFPMIVIRQLTWGAGNVARIARHGVTPDEVEDICRPDSVTSETDRGRMRVIGLTGRKVLTAILAPQTVVGVYYVVTARTASREERQLYRRQ